MTIRRHARSLGKTDIAARLPLFAGSIPAPASKPCAGWLENGGFVQRAGSIDSLAPARSPLRGFVYVARLPPAPFPPPPLVRGFYSTLEPARPRAGENGDAETRPAQGVPAPLIRSLRLAHPCGASSMSLGSRRLHSSNLDCWRGVASEQRFVALHHLVVAARFGVPLRQ